MALRTFSGMRKLGMLVSGFQAWGSFIQRSSHSGDLRKPTKVRSGPTVTGKVASVELVKPVT